MFDFNYNDGSIWKISQDENGNNVLVKEVDDEDEDSVVRAPSLNNLKTASSSKLSIVSEKTFGKVASMFYGQQDENWIQLILSTDSRHSIIGKLNEKFESVVNEKLAECQISDSNEQDDVKNLIATALENEINSVESLNNFLKNYIQDKINKAGQQRKYFS
ncbi:hypothetical protein D3C75_536980 [compost metagenome]